MSEKNEDQLRANTETREESSTNLPIEKIYKIIETREESSTNLPIEKISYKSTEIRPKSLINLPPEKIRKEFITPYKVHWVALQNLNDIIVGNYFSMILFGLSTAFIGAWLTSSDETQKFLCGLFGLIMFTISVILHVVFVFLKIYKLKKEAIKRSDFE